MFKVNATNAAFLYAKVHKKMILQKKMEEKMYFLLQIHTEMG